MLTKKIHYEKCCKCCSWAEKKTLLPKRAQHWSRGKTVLGLSWSFQNQIQPCAKAIKTEDWPFSNGVWEKKLGQPLVHWTLSLKSPSQSQVTGRVQLLFWSLDWLSAALFRKIAGKDGAFQYKRLFEQVFNRESPNLLWRKLISNKRRLDFQFWKKAGVSTKEN